MITVGPGKYDLKSFIDDWQTAHRKKHGKFGTVDQYPDFPHDRIFYSTLSQYQVRGVSIHADTQTYYLFILNYSSKLI